MFVCFKFFTGIIDSDNWLKCVSDKSRTPFGMLSACSHAMSLEPCFGPYQSWERRGTICVSSLMTNDGVADLAGVSVVGGEVGASLPHAMVTRVARMTSSALVIFTDYFPSGPQSRTRSSGGPRPL